MQKAFDPAQTKKEQTHGGKTRISALKNFKKQRLFCRLLCGHLDGLCLLQLLASKDIGDQRKHEKEDGERDHSPTCNCENERKRLVCHTGKGGQEGEKKHANEDLYPLLFQLILPIRTARKDNAHDGKCDQIHRNDHGHHGSLSEDHHTAEHDAEDGKDQVDDARRSVDVQNAVDQGGNIADYGQDTDNDQRPLQKIGERKHARQNDEKSTQDHADDQRDDDARQNVFLCCHSQIPFIFVMYL